jgi:hypothetical protein
MVPMRSLFNEFFTFRAKENFSAKENFLTESFAYFLQCNKKVCEAFLERVLRYQTFVLVRSLPDCPDRPFALPFRSMPDEPPKINREQEFESFKEDVRRWFLADCQGKFSHEDFRELLTKIIWLCEEILDAEETDATDAVADPTEFVRSLLFGILKPADLSPYPEDQIAKIEAEVPLDVYSDFLQFRAAFEAFRGNEILFRYLGRLTQVFREEAKQKSGQK